MMKRALPVILGALMALTACSEYDSWSTSTSDLLTFSADTVAFDTIISGQASTTQTLIAFNNRSKGIRISQVRLEGGSSSYFKANVDGQYLSNGVGEDFEVRDGDSIYVRLAVNLPETDSDEIQSYSDALIFTLESGAQQRVELTANGMDVIVMRGEVITGDVTLDAKRPYLVYDSLVVAEGAWLYLPEGCTMMMHDSVSIKVHGQLYALGSVESPVTFRGDRTDNMFDYLPYDNTPNRWGGIHFYSESRGNVLEHVDIHSGDYGIICDSTTIADTEDITLILHNSVIHNVGGTALDLGCCLTEVSGTQLSNALGECVSVVGGYHTFTHCTLAQFYPFSSARSYALYISNYENEAYVPLYRCWFLNCVITGYADDEVMGNIQESQEGEVDYLFQNCLLRTPAVTGSVRFVDNLYDLPDSLEVSGSDHFTLFDTTNFLYDFTPDSLSLIRGLALPAYSQQYPIDRNGNLRLADGAPDAGAYEGQ